MRCYFCAVVVRCGICCDCGGCSWRVLVKENDKPLRKWGMGRLIFSVLFYTVRVRCFNCCKCGQCWRKARVWETGMSHRVCSIGLSLSRIISVQCLCASRSVESVTDVSSPCPTSLCSFRVRIVSFSALRRDSRWYILRTTTALKFLSCFEQGTHYYVARAVTAIALVSALF